MERSYWSQVVSQRLGRRRVLATSGAALLGGALLAACGSGGSASSKSTASGGADKSGLVDTPQDTTAQARRGGVLKDWTNGDAQHFDAVASNANGVVNWVSAFAYPRLLKFATPKYKKAGGQ